MVNMQREISSSIMQTVATNHMDIDAKRLLQVVQQDIHLLPAYIDKYIV